MISVQTSTSNKDAVDKQTSLRLYGDCHLVYHDMVL